MTLSIPPCLNLSEQKSFTSAKPKKRAKLFRENTLTTSGQQHKSTNMYLSSRWITCAITISKKSGKNSRTAGQPTSNFPIFQFFQSSNSSSALHHFALHQLFIINRSSLPQGMIIHHTDAGVERRNTASSSAKQK